MHIEARCVTIRQLSRQLASAVGRPVVDRTGLTGRYAFTIEWRAPNRKAPLNSDVGSIFDAVQQLGLKLDAAKGPVEKVIVDHAEKLE
jgi:uncharacterized protein (TIGR03435 family)